MSDKANFDAGLIESARALLAAFRRAGLKLATAESCTGGMAAAVLTEIAGSSDIVERGFVTYSNEAKNELLGVSMKLIVAKGAVSKEIALAMARGAIKHSRADVAVSITGIAGPGGARPGKPVGLVHFAALHKGRKPIHVRRVFKGSRARVRAASVLEAFRLLRQAAKV